MKPKNKPRIVTYAFDQELIRVHEIVQGKYEQYDQTKYLVPHRRDFFSFFLVTSGYLKHSIDFQRITTRAGELFFLAPHQVHLVEGANLIAGIGAACKHELFSPSEDPLPILQNPKQIHKLALDRGQARLIGQHLKGMLAEYQNHEAFSGDILKSSLSTLLFFLSRVYQQQERLPEPAKPEETKMLKKFKDLVDSQWNRPLTVDSCEQALYLGAGKLNQLTKKQTGKSASELIQEKRLLEAKRLLLYSLDSVKEISYQTGFEDPAYFNRFFRRWTQSTPLQFRLAMQKKYNKGW